MQLYPRGIPMHMAGTNLDRFSQIQFCKIKKLVKNIFYLIQHNRDQIIKNDIGIKRLKGEVGCAKIP